MISNSNSNSNSDSDSNSNSNSNSDSDSNSNSKELNESESKSDSKIYIIFICTSNTCRSPIAEYFAKKYYIDKQLNSSSSSSSSSSNSSTCSININNIIICSRALSNEYEPENSPPSNHGITIMQQEYNIDITKHKSKMLTINDIQHASLLIGVTKNHCNIIKNKFPITNNNNKLRLGSGLESGLESGLGLPIVMQLKINQDISDPWHQDIKSYKKCAAQIQPLVYALLDSI